MESNPPIVTLISNKLGFLFGFFDFYVLLVVFAFVMFNFGTTLSIVLISSVGVVWLFGILAGRYEFSRMFASKLVVFLLVLMFAMPIARGMLAHVGFVVNDAVFTWWQVTRYLLLYLVVVSSFSLKRVNLYAWIILGFVLLLMLIGVSVGSGTAEAVLGITLTLLFWVYYAYKQGYIKFGALLAVAVCIFVSTLYGGANLHPLIAVSFAAMFIARFSGFVVLPLVALSIHGAYLLREITRLSLNINDLVSQLVENVAGSVVFVVVGAGVAGTLASSSTIGNALINFMGVLGVIVLTLLLLRFLLHAYLRFRGITVPSLKSYFLAVLSVIVLMIMSVVFSGASDVVGLLPIFVVLIGIGMCAYETSNSQ